MVVTFFAVCPQLCPSVPYLFVRQLAIEGSLEKKKWVQGVYTNSLCTVRFLV